MTLRKWSIRARPGCCPPREVGWDGLPDPAVLGWSHGRAGFAAEGAGEAGLVDDRAVGAEMIGRVWVGEGALASGLGAGVFAPVLRPGDVKALRPGEAVYFLIDIDSVLRGAI